MKKFTIKINEDKSSAESIKSMSNIQLEDIKKNLEFIISSFNDLEEIPAWVSDKISVTNHHMDAIQGWIRSLEEKVEESVESSAPKHYLKDENDDIIDEFETYDKESIKKAIISFLKENPKQEVTHEKELIGDEREEHYGNQIINFYRVNPNNGEVSKVVTKGDKEYYVSLEK